MADEEVVVRDGKTLEDFVPPLTERCFMCGLPRKTRLHLKAMHDDQGISWDRVSKALRDGAGISICASAIRQHFSKGHEDGAD